jgi:hypothetical protein
MAETDDGADPHEAARCPRPTTAPTRTRPRDARGRAMAPTRNEAASADGADPYEADDGRS